MLLRKISLRLLVLGNPNLRRVIVNVPGDTSCTCLIIRFLLPNSALLV